MTSLSDSWGIEIRNLIAELNAADWDAEELVFTRISLDALSSAISQKWFPDTGAPDIEDVVYMLSQKFPTHIGVTASGAASELIEAMSKADYYLDEGFPHYIIEELLRNWEIVSSGVLDLLKELENET